MKEYLTRREAIKRGALAFMSWTASAIGGRRVDSTSAPRDVIKGTLLGGGVIVAAAGLAVMGEGINDNLPTDDQGNQREIIGYTGTDNFHMFNIPRPIYGRTKQELEK